MDKKPLIGVSILAVVLLVLGSLSNVVGYQSVKSTINDSPLFATRTQRAINQQQNVITSQYLGMGKETLLQFSTRDNRNEQLKKAIDIISKMDDTTFERFTELCIQRAKQHESLKELTPSSIVKALHTLKTKSVKIINSFMNGSNQKITTYGMITFCVWFPGCIPIFIFYIVVTTIYSIVKQIIFTLKDLCGDMEKYDLY